MTLIPKRYNGDGIISIAVTGTNTKTINLNKRDGSTVTTDFTDLNNSGTVTSVAALNLGTIGTDLNSSVATGTTTPVITLNVPTASSSNRGALSSADWTTFNNKQAALVSGTNIKTVNGVTLLGSGNLLTSTGSQEEKSITIESPTATEDISMFFSNRALTITRIVAVVRGTTPSVTWTIKKESDRSAAGTAVVTAGTTTNSQTTGSSVTTFDSAEIAANNFVWLETTAQSGTVEELNVTIIYTIN